MSQDINTSLEKYSTSEFEKKAQIKLLPMSDGATIKVYVSQPNKELFNGYSVIIVPGWGTVIPSWNEFLVDISNDFQVIYFESREKVSCSLPKGSEVGMDRMSYDIKEIIDNLELQEDRVVLFGSCLGATTIAYGLYKQMYNPFMPVLIAPPARFEVPPVLRQLIPITPASALKLVKPIVIWWIKTFKTESPEQAAKYIRTLNEADGKRWKKVGLPLAFKRYWKIFPEIKNHLLLIAAEEDKMHDTKVTQKIRNMLQNALYVNLGSNKNTHNRRMSETIREYLPDFIGKNNK